MTNLQTKGSSEVRAIVYVLLNILLLPAYGIGFLSYFLPIIAKRGTVSGTAYEPFNARLIYHLLGTRPDPTALQLAGGLPATNRFVMETLIKPMAWTSRVTGYTPPVFQYPPPRPITRGAMIGARCEFLDAALLECVSPGDQVVILGAGWDTRAYGLLQEKDATIFEVDAPATQAVKRRAIEKTGIDASSVTFVSCDFNKQGWLDALQENGFDREKRTYIHWEGVTMYLEEATVQRTLKMVASLPSGSHVACDFFSREWMEGTPTGTASRIAVKATYGEPFVFGFPVEPEFSSALSDYLESCGLSLERALPMGDDTIGGLPFGGILLAKNSGVGSD